MTLPLFEPSAGPEGVTLPKQARSRESFRRMVAAARRLMVDGGLDAVTVQDVIRLSDSGAGSFYARFESREALVAYLYEDLWGEAERWSVAFLEPARWKEAPLEVRVGEVVRVLVRGHFAHEPALRAFWTRAISRPADPIMERTAEWDVAFVEGWAGLLEEYRDEIQHPEPERAVRLATFQVLATLRGHLFFPDSLSLGAPFTLPGLILELTRSVLTYLGVSGSPERYADLLKASARLPRL